MFRIIKWYIVTCAMVVLFSSEMVQAGRTALEASNVKKSGGAFQGKSRKVTVSKNSKAVANKTTRASAVTELDKEAAGWDFTDFNFMELYEYFDGLIGHITFLKATRAGNFSSIAALAQALVDESQSPTLSEAKFFIYSVLKASYDRNMKDNREEMLEFKLLKQADDTMVSHTMDVVEYYEADLGQDYEHTMISSYPDHFLENSEITRVQLANQLSSLITVINVYANISEKCNQEFAPKKAAKKPQLSELLTYYPKHEHAAVFVFLVSYPLEIETVGENPMNVETTLKQQTFSALKQLWDAAIQSGGEDQVAEMAIYLFRVNPLGATSCSVPKLTPCQASSVVYFCQSGDTGIDWDKIAKIKGNGSVHQMIKKNYYIKLTDILQTNQAAKHLSAQSMITDRQVQEIKHKSIPSDQAEYLVFDIILPSLRLESMKKLKALLNYMSENGDTDERDIAEKIYEDLRAMSK